MAMETYHGHVRTPADAIKLFEACRLGILPRVQRRLSEKERQSIKSGSVFVWDEREAGMRRWTDGKSWSASRVSGSFLTYREMEGKRGGGNFVPPPVRRHAGKTPDSGRGSDEDADMDGEGPDGYRYKPDGLMKQSFSITTSGGQHLHLISYYARPHAQAPDLPQPTTDPTLRGIVPAKGMYPESTVHEQSQGPVTTRAPMQSAYMASPQHMMAGPRPGPPAYYQPVTQGYAWPPSPAMTPPQFYDQYGRPVIFTTHSQPTSAHASPHPIHYSPQHPHVLPPTSGPMHQPTIFDRPPPPLQETALPPPPPQHRVAVTASVAPMAVPVYAPNPSSRVDQGRLVAEQQAQQAQQAQAQAHAQHAQMAQQAQSAQRIAQQSQMALDPRLATSSAPNSSTMAPMQSPRTASVQPRSTPPQTYSQPPSTAQTPISPAPTSLRQENSQSIPSISNLVNGTLERSSPPPSTTLPPPTSTPGPTSTPQAHSTPTIPNTLPQPVSANGREDARSEKSAGSRAGSKSPKDGSVKEEADGPKDFPPEKMGEKMGFGEDVRALRVLDRKFCI